MVWVHTMKHFCKLHRWNSCTWDLPRRNHLGHVNSDDLLNLQDVIAFISPTCPFCKEAVQNPEPKKQIACNEEGVTSFRKKMLNKNHLETNISWTVYRMLQLNTQWFFANFCSKIIKKYLCRFTWIGTLPKVAALKDAGYEPFIVEAGTYSEIRPFFWRSWGVGGCWRG